jgi:probable rRNA maturation factor
MQDHPLIDLYISVDDDGMNTQIEQMLSAVNLDALTRLTLAETHIQQRVVMTLLVTDDKGIRDMNKQYREQDKATDVLSFPLLAKPLAQAPVDQLWEPLTTLGPDGQPAPEFVTPPDAILNLGDIIISWPTVLRQATEAGHDSLIELLYLLIHGILHLIGYDDQTETGYHAMVKMQMTVLQKLGYRIQ